MKHLILGYGYCAYHLANLLTGQKQEVTALARNPDKQACPEGLKLLKHDVTQTPLDMDLSDTILYYFIPPPPSGKKDTYLSHFLEKLDSRPEKIIYFGSSGVYGDHHGQWVDEGSPCHVTHDRQARRLDAERQWQAFCRKEAIPCILLRIAGIFGPHRLALEAVQKRTPVIDPKIAPFINSIYVRDLVNIASQLASHPSASGVFNVADGDPLPMGTLQQDLARLLHEPPAPFQSLEEAWQTASPMKREFLQASKRLCIQRLHTTLEKALQFTPRVEALQESLMDGESK